MEFDPVLAVKSATDLDALADRLEGDLVVNGPSLAVEQAGMDEVSQRAAATLRAVASSYQDAASRGILELRKLAAALRAQSGLLRQMDAENATGFTAAS